MNADLATARYRLAELGALIAEPPRAAILLALMDGSARPATELAQIAAIAPGTASAHLQRLSEGGLLVAIAQGRHRYYRLADEGVAALLETLIVARGPIPARASPANAAVTFARTCYRHLAGVLGVALFDGLRANDGLAIADDGVRLTDRGAAQLAAGGLLDVGDPRLRLAGRSCIDWTERRPHLAGALGVALTARFVEDGWLRRATRSRALTLTPIGREGLRRVGVDMDAVARAVASDAAPGAGERARSGARR